MNVNEMLNDNYKIDKSFKQFLKQINALTIVNIKYKIMNQEKLEKSIVELKKKYSRKIK